ncbi:MAG TPA: ECF-type sigma factor [Woeseiaceae bacterium]|nr:ECF-type sigma factor [Woeseiaceae bacterium]
MSGDITQLLKAVSSGDDGALASLFQIVYDELRAKARAQLAGSMPQTLGATALVHEVYIKLTAGDSPEWNDRAHFYGVAARAMRHIVIDHARARNAARRGGKAARMDMDIAEFSLPDAAEALLSLDTALDALEERDARLARLVELRFFAGLSVAESAQAMSISERTVKRNWRLARAFIYAQTVEA